MFALHSPKRLAEAEITAGLPGSSTARSTAEARPPPTRSRTRRIASTRPTLHAAERDRRANAEPADGAEPGGVGGLLLVDVGLAQPERAADHQGQRGEHREADRELVASFHSDLRAGAGSDGLGPALDELAHHRIVGRLDLRHGADLADRTLVQHGDPVADGEGAAHVVGDDQPGDAEVAGADHELVHDRRGDGVEPGRGLVVENVARLEGDRARDSHPLSHPAAQLRRVLVLEPRAAPPPRGSPRSAPGSRPRRSPA